MKVPYRFLLIVAVVLASTFISPARAERSTAPARFAEVRYIYHGMAVQPPSRPSQSAKLKTPLYSQYGLQTGSNEKGSIGFNDGTALSLNQQTQARLESPNETYVLRGEVAQVVKPGTRHRIRTAGASADSIGTIYDVRVSGNATVFTVLHGALQVTTPHGAVTVKSSEASAALLGARPQQPHRVDAATLRAVFAWTDIIPQPDFGEDVALDQEGGSVVRVSSERPEARWHADKIDDGLLSYGWESAPGAIRNQAVTVGFGAGRLLRVYEVIVDPSATGGDPSSMDLRDFQIQVSSTGTASRDFATVYTGHCRQEDSLQVFTLSSRPLARYVRLVALDNWGSPRGVAVSEWEVIANTTGFSDPWDLVAAPKGGVYVIDTGNDRVQELNARGEFVRAWGRKGSGPGQMILPNGIARGPDGTVWVSDGANNRIQRYSPTGKFLGQFGTWGTGPGQFEHPEGLTIDRAGNVYVADSLNNRIQKLSATGTPLAQWGSAGSGPGQFMGPTAVAVDTAGNVYVTDSYNSRVQKLSPTGEPLAQWGSEGSGPNQFQTPDYLDLDSLGDIYVTDPDNNRIVELSPQGVPVAAWTGSGSPWGYPVGISVTSPGHFFTTDWNAAGVLKFAGKPNPVDHWGVYGTVPNLLGIPLGITVDRLGDVYIADSESDSVQVRSPRGDLLAYYGRPAPNLLVHLPHLGEFYFPTGVAVDAAGAVYVADVAHIQKLTDTGPVGLIGTLTTVGKPWDVVVDKQGNLYATDIAHDTVVKLSPSGHVIATWGKHGSGPGEFNRPEGIALDAAGNIYVVDSNNNRIQKLSPTGEPLTEIGANLGLNGPDGIAIDSAGNLYVADTFNDRILKLSPTGGVMTTWGSRGPGPGQFLSPSGLALDSHGNIYITDAGNSRVVKLSPAGQVLAIWG